MAGRKMIVLYDKIPPLRKGEKGDFNTFSPVILNHTPYVILNLFQDLIFPVIARAKPAAIRSCINYNNAINDNNDIN
jgi:hypothetical protein